jgi:hypothetical protein
MDEREECQYLREPMERSGSTLRRGANKQSL